MHKGHRQRVREKYEKSGSESFKDHELLELVLFHAIPYRDTNPIAHRLLDTFGSLGGVFSAKIDALCAVEGVTRNAAILLKTYPDIWRAVCMSRSRDIMFLRSIDEAGRLLGSYFTEKTEERSVMLCLDSSLRVLNVSVLYEGSFNSVQISVKKVAETALSNNATAVIIAHNHPAGIAVPSSADRLTTDRIFETLKGLDILLLDHLVSILTATAFRFIKADCFPNFLGKRNSTKAYLSAAEPSRSRMFSPNIFSLTALFLRRHNSAKDREHQFLPIFVTL